MTDFLDGANTTNDRKMIGMNKGFLEPGIADAFDKWDGLSKSDLQNGLDKIEKYVELIERERRTKKM
jgi:hypothetical protein